MSRNGPALPGGPIPRAAVDPVNTRFRLERDRYDLRYRCEDCEHYDPVGDRCSQGWPKEHFGDGPHRCRDADGAFVFCKYFELNGSGGT
ncbi:MAG: hypothetical protein AMXMBFR64_32200 [Myxococcales bacterium]